VVAATYPGGGPRADQGEATDAQWKAFNDEIDAYLAHVHAASPIAVVIRPIDDEYSTELSPWHAWSCRELPRFLPFLAAALSKKAASWYLRHACELWREWLAELALDEQKQIIAALDADARAVLKQHGGVPKPRAPQRKSDPEPTLDEQKRAWAAIPRDADAIAAFAAAFQHLWFVGDDKWELLRFVGALAYDGRSPEHDALLVEVVQRALGSPACEWPDTHWRPDLVEALVRLGRVDEARREIARVAAGANSYSSGNWVAMLRFLDATGRGEDADAMFRVANRYVTGFDEDRKVAKAPHDQKERAARVLLELAAPVLDDLSALDEEALSHFAFLFGDLVDESVAGEALGEASKRARAEQGARRERRIADGHDRLAHGERLDEAALKTLIDDVQRVLAATSPTDLARLARAALEHASLVPQVSLLAYYAQQSNALGALAVYRALAASPPPAEAEARESWLQAANNALVLTHQHEDYAESAALADRVVAYARENPHITHSAACSYAAVQRYDDAFAQAKLAVELGYKHLDKLRVDKDLGPLLQRADFKKLFASKR
jgi:hypothetical protein